MSNNTLITPHKALMHQTISIQHPFTCKESTKGAFTLLNRTQKVCFREVWMCKRSKHRSHSTSDEPNSGSGLKCRTLWINRNTCKAWQLGKMWRWNEVKGEKLHHQYIIDYLRKSFRKDRCPWYEEQDAILHSQHLHNVGGDVIFFLWKYEATSETDPAASSQ